MGPKKSTGGLRAGRRGAKGGVACARCAGSSRTRGLANDGATHTRRTMRGLLSGLGTRVPNRHASWTFWTNPRARVRGRGREVVLPRRPLAWKFTRGIMDGYLLET